MSKFPKTIYVTKAVDDESILLADTNANSADDGVDVAIYELRTVRRKRVTHILVEKGARK